MRSLATPPQPAASTAASHLPLAAIATTRRRRPPARDARRYSPGDEQGSPARPAARSGSIPLAHSTQRPLRAGFFATIASCPRAVSMLVAVLSTFSRTVRRRHDGTSRLKRRAPGEGKPLAVVVHGVETDRGHVGLVPDGQREPASMIVARTSGCDVISALAPIPPNACRVDAREGQRHGFR